MIKTGRQSQITALRDALRAVKPVTPMSTLECLELAMVNSKDSPAEKRPRSGAGSPRRKNRAATEQTPALPRPHCEMCGASECLRPWLDDRCHCDACLAIGTNECDSPRMKARRATKPSCATFFASKCHKNKYELAKQNTQTPLLKQISSTSNVMRQFSKNKDGAASALQKQDLPRCRSGTLGRKLSATRALSLPTKPNQESAPASDVLKSFSTTASNELKRSSSAQPKVLKSRSAIRRTVTPFSAAKLQKEFSKQKDALTKQVGGFSSKCSASSGATISTTASSDFGSTTNRSTMGSRRRPRSVRKNPGFESPAALPRPHCEVCGASECLRPSLDDRCHCNACIGIDGQDCDSPRMKTRRTAHPSCASFYASRCLKDKNSSAPRPHTPNTESSKTAGVNSTTKPTANAMKEVKLPSREGLRSASSPESTPSKNHGADKSIGGRTTSVKETAQVTSPVIARAQSRPQKVSRARSPSRQKRDPSIESPPQLPRPHCEMCGASECLRPWLDDRCHCDACLEENCKECDSPRMKTRRALKPSCATFYASKCMKHVFEQKAAASTENQDTGADAKRTTQKKHFLPQLSRKASDLVPAPNSVNHKELLPGPEETLQSSRKLVCEDSKEKAVARLTSGASSGNLIKQASKPTTEKQSSAVYKPCSTGRTTGASCGLKNRRRRDPSVEATPALPRPHCPKCGHNECLRPELDDRCHCDACMDKQEQQCDSPRMKARKRSRPSCESFCAAKSANQSINRKATGGRYLSGDEQGQFGSPQHSPSNGLNQSRAAFPSLLPSKKDIFDAESQNKKQRKAGSHSFIEAEHLTEEKPWDEDALGGVPQSPSVFCIQRAWDPCRKRGRRGAVQGLGAQEQLAAAVQPH